MPILQPTHPPLPGALTQQAADLCLDWLLQLASHPPTPSDLLLSSSSSSTTTHPPTSSSHKRSSSSLLSSAFTAATSLLGGASSSPSPPPPPPPPPPSHPPTLSHILAGEAPLIQEETSLLSPILLQDLFTRKLRCVPPTHPPTHPPSSSRRRRISSLPPSYKTS